MAKERRISDKTRDRYHSIKMNAVHQNRKMMHNSAMRTTVNLDEDTHGFVNYYARAKGISFSAAVEELIRKAQAPAKSAETEIRRSPNGFPLLPPSGRTITSEMVKKLEEEEFDPEKFA